MVLKSPLERTQAFSTPRKPTAGIPASNVEDALKYIKENASGGLASVEDDPAPKLGGDLDLNGHVIAGLATVATSGSYSDLTGKPTLGTAAAHAASDFATAAQGAKADSAVQPGDIGTSAALNVDTDGAMTANSDTRVPSQKAVRTYLDARIAALDVVEIKGGINCSTNPNYPAADAGFLYKVTIAGKIGGASGPNVEAGDTLLCFVDGSASGNHATVGANWTIIQVNIDGAVIGPASSTSGNIATYSGTSGKVIQDGGKALPSGSIVGTTDTQSLTNKTLVDPIVGTQTVLDNSTKAASTAYVDRTTREKLTANRTYYVRTDGSNANNGLSNTSGDAFLTIQKAIDTVAALDTNGRNVTIQVGAGTYTGTLVLPYVPGAKAATLQIVGDTTTPSNCLISCTSVFSAIQSAGCGNGWYVRGFKIQTTTTGYCVYVGDQLSTIYLGENDYGGIPSGYSHISARYGGRIAIQTGYTISGGANSHILTNEAGILTLSGAVTVALSGTPAFSQAFAYALGLSIIEFGSTTWSGSATGSRYKSEQNSLINTFGQSTSWLPGSTAGSTATGGLYA